MACHHEVNVTSGGERSLTGVPVQLEVFLNHVLILLQLEAQKNINAVIELLLKRLCEQIVALLTDCSEICLFCRHAS
jgi:hypothetical protein